MNLRPHSRLGSALKRVGLLIMSLTAIALIAACSSDSPDARPTVTPLPVLTLRITLDEVVSLTPSQSAEISGEDVTLAFHRVANDSRCAEGAQCVTAGNAIVVMSLTGSDFDSGQIEMIVSPGGGGEVLAGPYTVTLASLEPDPPPEGGVDSDDYAVIFNVSKK